MKKSPSSLKKSSLLLAASLACLSVPSLLSFSPVQAAPPFAASKTAAPMVRLPGQLMPDALRSAALVGRKSGLEPLSLVLTLPLRDPTGVRSLLERIYTPGDSLFHQFLTPDEFTARFGPSQQTYNAVIAFAKASGLTVTQTHKGRTLLEVAGSASAIEAAFHVRLLNYADPATGRLFHAPDSNPAIPASLVGKITGVVGLENATLWRSHKAEPLFSGIATEIGSGPGGGLTPSDIKAAYNLSGTTLTGKGQTLALLELDSYTPTDITSYESQYGLPFVPLVDVLTDGAVDVPSTGDGPGEVTLDIELMTALAPGASSIRVYEAPNSDDGLLAAYGRIAEDDLAKDVSTSWGKPDNLSNPATLNSENTLFTQMAMQGQSLYAASADAGAYDDSQYEVSNTLSVDDPASQPMVTGVGGTTLNVTGPGGTYVSETTWADTKDTSKSPHGSGGGGGISPFWSIPSFQAGVAGAASTTQRNVPDVSLDADPGTGYSIYYSDPTYGSGYYIFGGTSCAAPLWAAFTALVNQQRETNGQTDLGFPNTTIYQIAQSTSYAATFHDIADGSTNLFYAAGPGYDNATGWGSFIGANLLAQMAPTVVVSASPIASLTIAPPSVVGGLTAKGTVTLTNPAPVGGASVALSVSPATAPTTGPVSVPATVLVAAGATTGSFTLTTTAVTASTPVTVTASYSGGTKTAVLTVTAPPAIITPASLVLSPASVGGGMTSTGTVTLSGPAPAGGISVAISSSSPAATLPTSVAIAAGVATGTFTVTTAAVATDTTAAITVSLNGGTQTATLTILAPALEPITLAPTSVIGGDGATETLTLSLPALTGGATVTLTSDSPTAVVPASALIPAGGTSVIVPVTTSTVAAATTVTLTASYNGISQTVKLTVKATPLSGLSLAPSSVIGGLTTVGTITLGAPAPTTGLTATLTSSDPAAQVPATVTIPPNATSASFPIPTANVAATVKATLTVQLGTLTQTASLTILPIQITTVSLAPNAVVTGSAVIGKITLNAPAPAGGLTVTLSSSTAAATVPASVLIPAKSATATFPIATPHAGTAVISALVGGAAQTATLTVNGAPGTTFPAGLNLISAPYDYTGSSLDALFGYTGVVVATSMPGTAGYSFTPNAPADTLHLGRGYWINLPKAVTLSTVGTPANPSQDFSIALSPGWNEIGQPWTTSQPLSSLSVSAGGAAVSFDQASSGSPLLISSLVYRYQTKSGTTPGSYIWVRDTDSLQPGLGYWIYAYQAVTLIVPHH